MTNRSQDCLDVDANAAPPPARDTGTGHSALVLGAGIQGVSVALALKHIGWRVELVDRAPEPLLGASLRGEGKLHLGYVYANEPARHTARLMIDGALSFATYLDRWLPVAIDWGVLRSEPFRYAVLRDSMVARDDLAEHYAWVDDVLEDRFSQGANYAGLDRFARAHPLPSVRDVGFAGDVQSVYRSSEVAVNPFVLRRTLLAALRAREIPFQPHSVVRSVTRMPQGFAVELTERDGVTITRRADVVVNCLWDGRLAVDATIGIAPSRPCLYRLKLAMYARLATATTVPLTTTFVLGPYGDVVRWGDDRVYLSWYPAGLIGISQSLEPPVDWQELLGELGATPRGRTIAAATTTALAERLTALRDLRVESVAGGIIVAWGQSDIDVPDSELHGRHAIGVHEHDGYVSVDTGKLTTAPLFAAQVARVLGSAHASVRP